MKNRYSLLFLGLGFIWVIIKVLTTGPNDRKENYEYFKNLNLVLTGIITDKQTLYSNSGMLYMDVRSSTIPEYDVRACTDNYYCVIHDNKAEIIFNGGMNEIQIGDSLVINSNINSFKCFRSKKLIIKRILTLSHYAPFYVEVRKFHRL